MRIEKSRLPKGMSYVLRSSVLEHALSSAGIMLETYLVHTPGQTPGCAFFYADFCPPNPNVAHERLYVQAGAAPSARSHEVRQYIECSVIPEFVAWVEGILALPINSPVRREGQRFSRVVPEQSLQRTAYGHH